MGNIMSGLIQNENDRIMRKPTFCLCFRYTDSTILLHSLAIFCACIARFVSDLVENPNCWFSHAKAQMVNVNTLPTTAITRKTGISIRSKAKPWNREQHNKSKDYVKP